MDGFLTTQSWSTQKTSALLLFGIINSCWKNHLSLKGASKSGGAGGLGCSLNSRKLHPLHPLHPWIIEDSTILTPGMGCQSATATGAPTIWSNSGGQAEATGCWELHLLRREDILHVTWSKCVKPTNRRVVLELVIYFGCSVSWFARLGDEVEALFAEVWLEFELSGACGSSYLPLSSLVIFDS